MNSASFWDRSAAKYAKAPIPNEQVYEQKLVKTREYLNPHSKVLELGCGTGTTALNHAPYANHIDAWDISPKMLEIARRKQVQQHISNVSFHCGEANSIALPEQEYDLAMAHSVLHLIEDKEANLRAMYASLKPGGVLVSSTACLGNKMNWLKLIAKPMKWLGFWPSVYFFTSTQLEAAITRAGFTIEYSWLPPKAIAHFFIARKPH
ncbi:class I SAM-dependent methyltransferase [Gilvimarinus agarilyticus]|uniref:class I SAM-dependent DNA methyltransferase n=1 Tax=unclassified Gilvimarinus TaxID=2642066 RepID=UPI001C086887|nr:MULTISPECIES: class I SAM-dependent methyltransferase [unclassified Gilvimarinus]MBU2886262.1 class I SAM-dependent methyltransferase [Gilvimarinus agarilyticus]MDO6570950.1 class I SAM-dependent methyltransferase [Gilvimarinus sp. 2_MG-2023]MDO6747763.1 class I SAM-dependent methyltransferase [Gilvimarinus sp. 1_MG-2023]